MDAFNLPKATPEEKAARTEAIQDATRYATEVPLRTMKAAAAVMPLLLSMARTGNPASSSDAGVGALAARSAVMGAWLNVRINAASLHDRSLAQSLLDEAAAIAAEACRAETEVLAAVDAHL